MPDVGWREATPPRGVSCTARCLVQAQPRPLEADHHHYEHDHVRCRQNGCYREDDRGEVTD
jgi:hypothetical protein